MGSQGQDRHWTEWLQGGPALLGMHPACDLRPTPLLRLITVSGAGEGARRGNAGEGAPRGGGPTWGRVTVGAEGGASPALTVSHTAAARHAVPATLNAQVWRSTVRAMPARGIPHARRALGGMQPLWGLWRCPFAHAYPESCRGICSASCSPCSAASHTVPRCLARAAPGGLPWPPRRRHQAALQEGSLSPLGMAADGIMF